jgi:hypothetical protein
MAKGAEGIVSCFLSPFPEFVCLGKQQKHNSGSFCSVLLIVPDFYSWRHSSALQMISPCSAMEEKYEKEWKEKSHIKIFKWNGTYQINTLENKESSDN